MARLTPVCRECGCDISHMRKGAAFCGSPHRKAWNNRRMIRGAELYDLLMANRYERELATKLGAWSVATNLTRVYRDSDKCLRDGRKSWDLREALDRMPLAYSTEGDRR